MYALAGPLDDPLHLSLECDPSRATFGHDPRPFSIQPGDHLDKRHWNTLVLDGSLSEDPVGELRT